MTRAFKTGFGTQAGRCFATGLLVLAIDGVVLGQQASEPRPLPAAAARVVPDHTGSKVVLADGSVVHRSAAQVANPRVVPLAMSNTRIVTWTETEDGVSKVYHAVSRNGRAFSRPQAVSHRLRLLEGSFDPLNAPPANATPLRAADGGVYVVQFAVQPLEEFRDALRGLGVQVHQYLPDEAHIVSMTPDQRVAVEALPFVRWVGPYEPRYRLSRVLQRAANGLTALPGPQTVTIQVLGESDEAQARLAEQVVALGGTVGFLPDHARYVRATLNLNQIEQIAGMDEVMFINRWAPPVALMNNVRAVSGANYLEGLPDNYKGQGVAGEVMDNGVLSTHPAFASIQMHGDMNPPVASHGTSTFGIVFGDGTGNISGRGVLPAGDGFFAYWQRPDLYDHMVELTSGLYRGLFSSNSWGSGIAADGDYQTDAFELDRAVYDADLVILFAQGNSGSFFNTSPEPWAKNIVSVGGIIHNNNANVGDDFWNSGAGSTGPASDGRIKPDLCHYFESILTTTSTGGYTSGFGGTSAATPITAGHFGLFFQMWSDGIFGNLVAPGGSIFSNRAHAATAKAVMINTADRYPVSGGGSIMRMAQGWGRIDVQSTYERRDEMLVIDESVILEEFEVAQFGRTLTPADGPFHVTLAYTDKEGTTSASAHLINDLTLKVTAPDGSVYWGNHGLTSSNVSAAGGSPNTVDNVENVFISNPLNGNYLVEVSVDQLAEDGHPETEGVMDADFALVITGGVECPFAEISADPADTVACPGETVVLSATAGAADLQWYKDGTPLAGETAASLTIDDFDPLADSGTYALSAENACGMIFSAPAEVAEEPAPTITDQPNQPTGTRCEGTDLLISMEAEGLSTLTYQWFHEDEALDGATSSSLFFSPLLAADAGTYYCQVTNECGVATDTITVNVAVRPLPEFLQQPQDTCGDEGATIQLTADATSPDALFWQWRKNGVNVPGANSSTLTLANLQASDAGDYVALAVVLNPTCIATSETAVVTVGECLGGCNSLSVCPNADVDCDDIVTGLDVAIITSSANFGLTAASAAEPRADVDGSGVVNGLDVAAATSSACFGL